MNNINSFFTLTLLIFSCNYCGKEFIQVPQKRTVKYIMKLSGCESYIYKEQETISLNTLGITSLRGLEKIDIKDKKVLDLTKNQITDLDYLTTMQNNTFRTILLNNNKIEQVALDDLFFLQVHCPKLRCLNLRDNLLSSAHREEIRGWHKLLNLTYTIKLRKKHAE